ncbi:protein-export chaperone SecB [Sphingomicrobium sp. XHP0239]|uniref:protein-export chaperone SecB n=1 Tax=Sphingomicrobium maritimum TaxID=3133972 RepID=UPI0031CC70BB
MADDNNDLPPASEPGTMPPPQDMDQRPSIQSLAQYVKDLSVENPRAPKSLQDKGKPQIDLGFNIEVNKVQDDVHEVTLKVDCSAKTDEGTQFVIDLSYAGLFALRNIPDDQLQPIMLVELPRQLFPFARQVIADATHQAGFQPLLLDPIDFGQVYMQQMQSMAAQQQGQGNGGPGDTPPAPPPASDA